MSEIIIVGGGIAGLAHAVALTKRKIPVRVFEQAPQILPVGAGITLAANAMQVLQKMGVADEIIKRGNCIEKGGIKLYNGKTLSQLNVNISNIPMVAIHRADLCDVLLNVLDKDRVHLGEKFTEYVQSPDEITVHFVSGDKAKGKLLVGADGIHSQVQQKMLGDIPLRNAKQTCFRGICDVGKISWPQPEFYESWGKNKRFGFGNIGQNRFYWFLTINYDTHFETPKNPKEYLLEEFRDWFVPIPEILSATPESAFLHNDLYDRVPMKCWHDGRAVLMGDAAHCTTPNMGQGGCMAIESAEVLAHCIEQNDDISKAIELYEKARMPRTKAITNQSWSFGKIATLSNPLTTSMRNLFVKLTPARAMEKRLKELASYDIYNTKNFVKK